MPRIRPLERKETPLLARPFLAIAKKMFGKDLTPGLVVARRPKILWLSELFGLGISGAVDAHIRELAQLRAAQVVGCPF